MAIGFKYSGIGVGLQPNATLLEALIVMIKKILQLLLAVIGSDERLLFFQQQRAVEIKFFGHLSRSLAKKSQFVRVGFVFKRLAGFKTEFFH